MRMKLLKLDVLYNLQAQEKKKSIKEDTVVVLTFVDG